MKVLLILVFSSTNGLRPSCFFHSLPPSNTGGKSGRVVSVSLVHAIIINCEHCPRYTASDPEKPCLEKQKLSSSCLDRKQTQSRREASASPPSPCPEEPLSDIYTPGQQHDEVALASRGSKAFI